MWISFRMAETTIFVGNHYEVVGGVVTKYYFAGGSRPAAAGDGWADRRQRAAAQPDRRHAQRGGFHPLRGAGDQPVGMRQVVG